MKITGMRIENLTTRDHAPADGVGAQRSAAPLDIYEEYAKMGDGRLGPKTRRDHCWWDKSENGQYTVAFLVIETDEGLEGWHGPIEYRSQLLVAMEGLREHLIGRDPLETRLLWDIMSRFERHASTGVMMMAISVVDIALWDLKGKILGQPVYKLLGGGRPHIKPYLSTLSFATDADSVRTRARQFIDMGFEAQKWFFPYGPGSGTEGMRHNLAMAQALREAVGPDYPIMFDCWMGWDYTYARDMLRELEPLHPKFIEELFRPQYFESYRRIAQETSIPLAAGEHFYNRQQVQQFLKEDVFAYIQSDPEWSGGITETLRIADLCEIYGVKMIPHGHNLLPAMHVIAASSPEVAPMGEYLLNINYHKTCFFRRHPLIDGYMTLNETPGIGEDINWDIVEKREVIHEFAF